MPCFSKAQMMPRKYCLIFLALSALSSWVLGAPIRAIDDTGQVVLLQQPANRIVALAPHVVETLFAAGAGDKIVGAVDYSDYPPSAKSIPRVGGYAAFNLEAIAALKPDLVIAWASGNSPSAIEKIRSLGIPIYLSQINTVSEVAKEIDNFGTLAGTQTIAASATRAYRKKLEDLTRQYRNKSEVRVFYQISESPLMTIGGKQIISNALEICGGKNIFSQLMPMAPVVSIESVLAANPEAIMTSGMQTINPGALSQWKTWPRLLANERQNFFFINPDLMNRSGPRILEGTQMLCQAVETARQRRPAAKS
jgi:iron complex transport system substrate-binding protein